MKRSSVKSSKKINHDKTAGPLVMVILDGWGVSPKKPGNAIHFAKTPFLDRVKKEYPYSELEASGKNVGLMKGQAGNSEAGHMNIGAGRVVPQDLKEIQDQIIDGRFFNNPTLIELINYREKNSKARIHILGLLTGDQSAHCYPDHLYALLDFLHRNEQKGIYLHLFSDGRDSGQFEGVRFVEKLIHNFKNGEVISSIIGRYYAMDRARNWARTKSAYELLTQGKGSVADNPMKVFTENYAKGFSDEFIPAVVINNPKLKPEFIKSGDIVVFINCRSDRARQLAKPFVQKEFERLGGFLRKKKLKDLYFVSFTDFGENLDHIRNAFPHQILENTLPCALAAGGIRQWYGAETEKYAHISYFLNGGSDKSRCGETRFREASKKVAKFDTVPAMSTPELTKNVIALIKKKKFDSYVLNFANADMLAHTGNFKACVKGIEVIDAQLKKLYLEVKKQGGTLIITADHGNAEVMLDRNGLAETQHSQNPVPFHLIGKLFHRRLKLLNKRGNLSQVAPTILKILGVKKPKEMTSKSLFN